MMLSTLNIINLCTQIRRKADVLKTLNITNLWHVDIIIIKLKDS